MHFVENVHINDIITSRVKKQSLTMNLSAKTFGIFIKRQRNLRKLLQKRLILPHISNIENGAVIPMLETIANISEKF